MKRSSYIKFISACLSAAILTAGISFVTSNAVTAPKLTIQSQNFSPTELPADRSAVLDVSISGNTDGFVAGSFGIAYDNALLYRNVEAADSMGETFEIIANEEQHIIWFVSASGSPYKTGDIAETMFQLTFELSSQAENGGNFPVQFVWKGLDGSPAYWYAEKGNNILSELQQNAQNGGVSIHGGSTLNYTELKMNQETTQQLVLYNAAGTPRWLSTNPKVASVDQNGVVTAISPGECNIRVNIDRTFKDCHVIVNEADIYSILDEQPLMLKNPKRDVILEYPDAQASVFWGSFDPDLIDIDQNGKLSFTPGVSCMATIYGECNGDAPMRDVYIEYSDVPEPTTEFIPPTTEFIFPSDPPESTTEFIPPTTEFIFPSAPPESTTEFIPPTTEFIFPSDPQESTTEFIPPTTEYIPPQLMLGDVDQSGELDIIDVIVVNKAILGKEVLSAQQNLAADYNQDNKIDSNDSLAILKKIVGLE